MLLTPITLRVAVGIGRCRLDPAEPTLERYCVLVVGLQQLGVSGAAEGGPGRG